MQSILEYTATIGELAELLDEIHGECKNKFGITCGICNSLRRADALLAGGNRGASTAIATGGN